MRNRRNNRGMVLIFALWVLGVLTILAVSVAAGIREKIFLVARLDERSRMNDLLEATVKKTAGYIHAQMETNNFALAPQVKMDLFNNVNELSNISLGIDRAGVGYVSVNDSQNALRWGVMDEESKINLNKTNATVLTSLLMYVLSLKDEDASKLAQSLLDWRLTGESELTGFYSEDYYNNLQYPYPKKSADYETLDEMLLVKGMTKAIYDKLINYVTIYGTGQVNVNTASREVLMAIGMPESVVDKLLAARRGTDGLEATRDDNVFSQPYEISADVNAVTPLQIQEAQAIDYLNMRGGLTTISYYYTIQATGRLASGGPPKTVTAVYSSRDDKIVYWKER